MFNSLEEYIQTVTERFNKPRRNLLNEGVVKDDLVESFVDLSKFVEGKVGLIGQAVDEAVDAKNQAAAQYQAKNIFRLRSENDPAEDFDRTEGMLLKDITTVTGHRFWATGPEANTVRVKNNAMNSVGNVYTGLASTKRATRVSGVFSYDALVYDDRPVLMFNGGPDPVSLHALIHLELGPTYWSLKLKDMDTVETELRVLNVAGVERHGKSDTVNYLVEIVPGEKYFSAMEYTRGGTILDDILSIFLPDGRIIDYKGDLLIRSVMDKCYAGTWQLKGPAAYWHTVALGKSRAGTVVELANGVSKKRLLPLVNVSPTFRKGLSTTISPTSTGWYKIATAISLHANVTALVGKLKILSSSATGQSVYAEVMVNAYYDRPPTLRTLSYGFGVFGALHITRLRISTAPGSGSGNGEKCLEVYINTYSNPNARILIDFEGTGEVVKSPTVGSVPLLVSREQNIANTKEGVTRQSTNASKTFVPGIDPVKNILNTNYAAAGVTHFLDDTKAQPADEFFFARSAGFANNAIFVNLSDSSVIVTLSPGQTAWIAVDNGKFVLLSKGTI